MVDDFILMFGCLTFSASQIILYMVMEDVYWDEALIFDPSPQTIALAIVDSNAFYHPILYLQQIDFDIYFCSQSLLSSLLPSDNRTNGKINLSLESFIWNHFVLLGFLRVYNVYRPSLPLHGRL